MMFKPTYKFGFYALAICLLLQSANAIFLFVNLGLMAIYAEDLETVISEYEEHDGDRCMTCDMRFGTEQNVTAINGLFTSTEGYFCVWTKDRSAEEIAETTMHELAHYYIDQNPEHYITPQEVIKIMGVKQ